MLNLESLMFTVKDHWANLMSIYTDDNQLIMDWWEEIERSYTGKTRHYHNLSHLEFMLENAQKFQHNLNDWDMVRFAIFYHDIIYRVTKSDNEQKSAEVAYSRLTQLGVSSKQVKICYDMILATKTHQSVNSMDTDYLVDFDLAILGTENELYLNYLRAVRKEYSRYPGFLYAKGRRAVLKHFLAMDRIFKTREFYELYETQARKNLEMELRHWS